MVSKRISSAISKIGGIMSHTSNGVHSAALILGAAGLASRFLGVLRDRLLASHFGAGRELDIYYAAFQIPDFLNVIFLLGAASAAILPVFQEILARDRDEARRMISHIFTLFLAGGAVLGVLVFSLLPYILPVVTPGFSAEEQADAVLLSRIMLFSPVVLGLSSILSSVTQAFGKFLAYSLSPIFYNLGIMAGIVFFVPLWGAAGLAWGVTLGVFGHIAVQFIASSSLGFRPEFLWRGDNDVVMRIVRLSGPRIVALSLSNLTVISIVAFGSTLAAGSIAVFQLSYNLYFVPVGIFGISYATAIFPKLSRSWIARDGEGFFRDLYGSVRTILFWLIPSSVFFIILRAHIVRAALGAGVFSWEDTRLAAAVLAVLAMAMAADSLSIIFIRGFYALENTRAPLRMNISAAIFSVGLAFLSAYFLSVPSGFRNIMVYIFRIPDMPHPEVIGLALGFALGRIANAVFLGTALFKLARARFGIDAQKLPLRGIWEIVFASVFAGAAVYAARASFSATLPLISFIQVFWQGTASGLAGGAVYAEVLWILKNQDMRDIVHALHGRMLRLKSLPASWSNDNINP